MNQNTKTRLCRLSGNSLNTELCGFILLCDEAKKRGLDPKDFASAVVKRCGLYQGKNLVKKGNTDSLKGLKKTLFT